MLDVRTVASFIWNALLVLFPCFTPFSSLLECHCLCILPRSSLTSLHPCLPRPSLPWFFFMLSSYTNFIPLSLFYDYLLKYRFRKGKNVNFCCCFSLLYLSCPMTMAYSRYSKSFNQIIVFQTIQGNHRTQTSSTVNWERLHKRFYYHKYINATITKKVNQIALGIIQREPDWGHKLIELSVAIILSINPSYAWDGTVGYPFSMQSFLRKQPACSSLLLEDRTLKPQVLILSELRWNDSLMFLLFAIGFLLQGCKSILASCPTLVWNNANFSLVISTNHLQTLLNFYISDF